MAAPLLLYGLYLVAGAAGKLGAKYAVKKLGPNVVGELIKKYRTKDLATKARDLAIRAKTKAKNVLSASKDTGKPISKTPGVTFGGGTQRSAVIGRQRVRDYTLGRRSEGAAVGAAAAAGAIEGGKALINRIKTAKEEDAPTGSLKKRFINAVKSKTDDPKKITQASTDFDNFIKGKIPSLSFNYGGMVRKTKNRRSK
jgi:hypothetical protein